MAKEVQILSPARPTGKRPRTAVSRQRASVRSLRDPAELWRVRPRGTLVFFAMATLLGCQPSADSPSATPDAKVENVIIQEKERGPVRVELRVEPKNPSFADRIRYTITARAEQGVEVKLPDPGTNLGHFIIKDFSSFPTKETADGKSELRQTYVLEVVTSGEYTIPETHIAFVDQRKKTPEAKGDALVDDAPGGQNPSAEPAESPVPPTEPETFRLVTDPVTIQVASLENPESLEDLRPIEAPIEPPVIPASLKWPLIIAGSVVGGLLVITLLFMLLRHRKAAPPPRIPPEELAYREFEWLLAQEFTERDELKEFYFHLSRIVREYIERRFGLRAPESTTEEFLEDLARSDDLSASHKSLLRGFLEKADLVKFARYAPGGDEITASFEAAKNFVAETRPQLEEVTSGNR